MKEMIFTNYTTATAIAAGGQLALGSAVHGIGKTIRLSNNSIQVSGPGAYKVTASASYAVTGTGAATLSLLNNGTAVSTATETPGAAGSVVNLVTVGTIYIPCKCSGTNTITFTADVAGTENNLSVVVERM